MTPQDQIRLLREKLAKIRKKLVELQGHLERWASPGMVCRRLVDEAIKISEE